MQIKDKEQAIIEAAKVEFATLGVHGARMQAIADRAGVNKALLHYYFRSKEQLYIKILSMITTPFLEEVSNGVSHLAPGDVAGFVRVVADFIIEGGQKTPFAKILFTELSIGGQYLSKMDERHMSEDMFNRNIIPFIDDCIERGALKPYHPLKIFMTVIGMCWNIFLSSPITNPIYEQQNLPRDEAFYTDYLEMIVDMATNGLSPK